MVKKGKNKKKDNKMLYAGIIIAIIAISSLLLYTQTDIFSSRAYYYNFNTDCTGDLECYEQDLCKSAAYACFDTPTTLIYTGAQGYFRLTPSLPVENTVECWVLYENGGESKIYTTTVPADDERWHYFSFTTPYKKGIDIIVFTNEHGCSIYIEDAKLYYQGSGRGPLCPPYNSPESCEDNSCFWYYDECWQHDSEWTEGKPAPPWVEKCSTYDNEEDCEDGGCHWYDDACHSRPKESAQTLVGIISENPYIIVIGVFVSFPIIGLIYYLFKLNGGKKNGKKK